MSHNKQKKIAVINDFCGFGRCSLSVSLPIISAMKIQCCPLPTAIFSNHTGYDSFYRADFTQHMEAYSEEWYKLGLTFNGILTGFLGSAEQIDIVKHFFEKFKTSGVVTIVDPVMGDYGKLYGSYPIQLAERMRSLVPYADILTPNLTEACILTETEYTETIDDSALEMICKRLSDMGSKYIVISGIERDDSLVNFVYEYGKKPIKIIERKIGPCRSGTGDVFSSIIAAEAVKGENFSDSVQRASSFIAKALRCTIEMNIPKTDGICFEELLTEI